METSAPLLSPSSQQRRISRTLCTQILAIIVPELICALTRGDLNQIMA
jgi:hypothetical protein